MEAQTAWSSEGGPTQTAPFHWSSLDDPSLGTPVCPLSPPQSAVPVVAQYWARVPPSIEFFCSNLAHVLKYSDGNLISLSRVADYLLNSSDTIRCVMVPERKREKYRKYIARRKRRVAAGF